jgi:flagellin
MDAQQAFNNMQNSGGDYFAVSKITGHHHSIEGIDLVHNATQALVTITSAIEQVAGDRAEYGALQNRLEYTVSNLMNVAEFTTAARSRIEDADFAAESARLAKARVLQQTGTAMLAQANSSSQLVMSLIR